MGLIKLLLLLVIAAYRRCVSPFLPSSCRFHPTCSRYAAGAINEHGAGRGSYLALRRLARCHPWHPGGFDPVPGRATAHNKKNPATGENQTRIVST